MLVLRGLHTCSSIYIQSYQVTLTSIQLYIPQRKSNSISFQIKLFDSGLDVSYLDKAKLYAQASLNASSKSQGPDYLGFLLGASGVFALNAILLKGKRKE